MMKKYSILIILIFLSAACTIQTDYKKLLIEADSLMQTRPDSALLILENINTVNLDDKTNKAYYALLLTQARDKNYIVQTDDSLIQTAVHYYDSVKDSRMQAKVYFYWGCVYRDRNECPKAITNFLIAFSHLARKENTELRANLYSNLGYLYYNQGFNTEADSIYQLATALAVQKKDTLGLSYALSQRGMINIEKGKAYYPQAEKQLLKAEAICKSYSDSTAIAPIYHSLSTFYITVSDAEKALRYARFNRNRNDCRAYLILGKAYQLNAMYDSAAIYFNKTFTVDRYYITKADACKHLSEIAKTNGDTVSTAAIVDKRAMYLDSARTYRQSQAIFSTIVSHERKNRQKDLENYLNITVGVATLSSILILVVSIVFYLKNKRHKAEKRKWEEKLQEEIKQEEMWNLQKQPKTKEEYKTSVVYIKVTRIAKELAKTETRENLTEEEWQQLIALTNIGWNNIITYLNEKYNLSGEEMQICCLYIAQIPVKHIGHFVNGQVRSTIQLKSKVIVQKMKAPENMLLKNILFALISNLENTNQALLGHSQP